MRSFASLAFTLPLAFVLSAPLAALAEVEAKHKSPQLTSPDQVPEGLQKSDWASIRAAHTAWQHGFMPVEGQTGIWQARNPGQQWTTKFDGRGFLTTPKGGGWTWGLELEDAAEAPERPGTQVADKSGRPALSFPRGEVITEWFINDQRGLEQGWTLSAPTEIRLRVRGSLKASVSPQSINFGGQLNYSGLKAWDASGKTVPAHFEATAQGFAVRYDDTGAQYPITIDPIAQQAFLKSDRNGNSTEDWFGSSVAVSGDTVVIGAPQENSSTAGVNSIPNDSGTYTGAAYVFVRSGTTWSQQAYLKASQVSNSDYFGQSVAISGDTVVVGSHGEDSSTTGVDGTPNESSSFAGAAYVFVRSGTTWSQQAFLKASQVSSDDYFGFAVAVSGDTVVVGAHQEDSSTAGVNSVPDELASFAGAAYVFVRNGSTWSQQAYLKAGQVTSGDSFGRSVAVSGDSVVVGAGGEDGSSPNVNGPVNELASGAGAAYVFVRSGTTWSQQAYLKARDVTAGDGFGAAVAIAGNTVVVGATGEDGSSTGVNGVDNDSASGAGAAYVFVRSGTTWTRQAYLKASQVTTLDNFGNSVAISGDTVVVGAHQEDGSTAGVNGTVNELTNNAGAAYVFVRNGTAWSQQAYLKASQVSAPDYFGWSVAVSGDTVIAGAFNEDGSAVGINGAADESALNAGAAYVFVRSGTVWSQQAYVKAGNTPQGIGSTDYFGWSVAVSGDTVVVGAYQEDSDATGVNGPVNELGNNTGAAYVFVRYGTSWSQQAFLKAGQLGGNDQFGSAVAIAGDTLVVGAKWEDGSSTGVNGAVNELAMNAGAAYVFVRDGTTWSQQAYLKASQVSAGDNFGISVAVSGDTVVIGASNESGSAAGVNGTVNELALNAGAAYVFVRSGAIWSQQAYLKASQVTPDDLFGTSVAISGDTVVVGAHQEDGSTTGVNGAANELASNAGAAYVFVRSGTTWSQQAYLKAAQVSSFDQFGTSVAISGDTLVVGSITEDGATPGVNGAVNEFATDSGAAYVFVRSGTTWSQQAYLKASQVTNDDRFGISTSISGDTVVVGAFLEDGSTAGVNGTVNNSTNNAGAAFVFLRSGTTWSQQAYLKASQVSAVDYFGNSVSVYGDTVVAGAPYEDSSTAGINPAANESSNDSGAAYIFTGLGPAFPVPTVTGVSPATGSTAGGTSVTLTGTGFIGATSVTIGGTAATGLNVLNATTITCTTPAHAAGTASVLVTTPGGTNTANTLFTYRAPPAAVATTPSSLTTTGVTLNGTVNPNGSTTSAQFEYGLTTSYGSTASVTLSPSDGSTAQNVSATLSGLALGTLYHYRLSANNSAGTVSTTDGTFTTLTASQAVNSAITTAGLSGPSAALDATPFNDGVKNLLKYAFNMNLSGPDAATMPPSGGSGLPDITAQPNGGASLFRFEFLRRKNSGLIYTPQKSGELTNPASWIPLTDPPTIIAIDATWERVIYEEPYNATTTPQCYGRVHVTLP